MRKEGISREGQVLDRGPPGNETNLAHLVVRVAGTAGGESDGCGVHDAVAGKGRRAITVVNRSPGTVERAAPVGTPVVVIRTAHTPSLDQLLLSAGGEDGVGGNPDSNGADSSRQG